MVTSGEVFVAVRPDASGFSAEAERLIAGGLGPAAAKAASIIGGLFVGKEAINFAREGVDRLIEIQKTATITEARIKATGEAAGVSAQHIEDLAKAQQELSGTDRELIQQGENVLLGFRKIKAEGGVFDKTVKDATDLSVALGQDFPTAARNLGRALEDPAKAARALRAENVLLTTAQQEQIKAFIAVGDTASAQNVILKTVEGQVGGTAAAFGQTLAGQLAKAKVDITDTKASLVEGLAPALGIVASGTAELAQGIQGLPGPLRDTASLALAAGTAYVALARPIGAAVELFGKFKSSSAESAASIEADNAATISSAEAKAASTEALIAHTTALNANTVALQGQVVADGEAAISTGALVAAEGALVAEAPAVVAAEEEIGLGLSAMLGPIGLVAGAIGLAVVAFKSFGDSGLSVTTDLKGAVPSVAEFTQGLDETSVAILKATNGFKDQAESIAKQSIPAARNYNEALRAQGLSTDEVTAAIDKQEAANQAAIAGQHGMTTAAFDLTEAEDALAKATVTVNTEQQSRLDAINGSITAEKAYRDSVISTQDAVRGLSDAQDALRSAQQRLNDAQRLDPAEDRRKTELDLADAKLRQGDAARSLADEEGKLVKLRGPSGLATGTAAAVFDQERKVAEARNANERAAFAVADAERSLQNVQADGTAADQALAAATKGVEDAKRSVNDAIRKETDSYHAQADALAKSRVEQQKANGVTVDAATATRLQIAAIQDLEKQISPNSQLHASFDEQIRQLKQIGQLSGASFEALGNLIQVQSGAGDTLGVLNSNLDLLKKLGLIKAASGFSGDVSSPTLFLAGEAGRERVNIGPAGQGGNGGPVFGPGSIVVQFAGVVPTAEQALGVGRQIGSGIAEMTRDVRLAVSTR